MIFDNELYIFFNKFMKSYRLKFFALLLFQILSMLFLLIYPLLMKFLIDEVFVSRNISLLYNLIIYAMLLCFASSFATFSKNYIQGKLEISLFKDISTELHDSINYSKLDSFKKMKTGDLMYRILTNTQSVITLYVEILPEFIMAILTMISPLLIMMNMDFSLTIMVVSPVMLFFFFSRFFGNKIQDVEKNLLIFHGELYNVLNENLHNIYLIKSFNLQSWVLNNFKKKLKQYSDIFISFLKVSSVNVFLNDFLNELPTILLLIFGGICVLKGSITIGTFTAFLSYIAIFFSPILQLSQSWTRYKTELPSLHRIMELLKITQENYGGCDFNMSNFEIRFLNVNFSYESKLILNNFNFTFKKGLNFIIGENGVGKSTIFKLISQFYNPNSGYICIGNRDVKNYDLYELRKNITLIFSEPEVFEASIFDNILIGDLNADFSKIIDVSKKANVHDFVWNLPNKYDTIIGKNGYELSSGEKQKISLARCFLKDSPILLLDEFANSLDDYSKDKIMVALEELKKDKIIIIITHDLDDVVEGSNVLNFNKLI